MKVHGLATGTPETISHLGKEVSTGIFKQSVHGPLILRAKGVEGDVQVDLDNHGGEDKAVYLYSLENLHYFAQQRGDPPYPPGHFGENLTIAGLDDNEVHLGDQFEIGTALIEVTQPRVPCFKLGLRMKDPHFVREFLLSGRTGFYARILREGKVALGDEVRCIHKDPKAVSIQRAMTALIKGPHQSAAIEAVLSVKALSNAWRHDLQKRLKPLPDGVNHDP